MDFGGFAEPLVGQDLYEVEKALADRSNLDRYVKRDSNLAEGVKRERERKGLHYSVNVPRCVSS